MAMNGTTLGDAIYSAIQGLHGSTNPQAIWETIGAQIVAHIEANAIVAVPASGLVSGNPGSPVTGAATGTIS